MGIKDFEKKILCIVLPYNDQGTKIANLQGLEIVLIVLFMKVYTVK